MKQEFNNNYNENNTYNNSATPNPYSNAYGNNSAPNPYVNNGVSNQNNNYSNTGVPNQNNNFYNNYNNTGMPNPYANNGVSNQNNNYNNPVMPNQNNNFYNNYNNQGMPNQYNNVMPNQYNAGASQWQSPKKDRKTAVIILLAVLLPVTAFLGFIGLIFGIVFGTLNRVKETEEYDLAYSYLVNSETFEELDAEESDVKLRGYSFVTDYHGGDSHRNRSEFRFRVDGRTFIVVCHKDAGDEDFVCVECTNFD